MKRRALLLTSVIMLLALGCGEPAAPQLRLDLTGHYRGKWTVWVYDLTGSCLWGCSLDFLGFAYCPTTFDLTMTGEHAFKGTFRNDLASACGASRPAELKGAVITFGEGGAIAGATRDVAGPTTSGPSNGRVGLSGEVDFDLGLGDSSAVEALVGCRPRTDGYRSHGSASAGEPRAFAQTIPGSDMMLSGSLGKLALFDCGGRVVQLEIHVDLSRYGAGA